MVTHLFVGSNAGGYAFVCGLECGCHTHRGLNYAFKMRIVAFREMGNQPSMREEMRVEMRITRAWPAPNAA